MEPNTYYEYEFKMTNGAYSKSYAIDIDWTMEYFLVNIKQHIKEDFPLDQTQPISIIEAGQYYNVNGRDPEKAPALENSQITLRDHFNKRLLNTAFYVKC